MYFPLIIAFVLILALIIVSIQNSMPLDLRFLTYQLQMTLSDLSLYSSLFGGAIVAVLSLPKLAKKYFQIRSLNRKMYELKKRIAEMEKERGGEYGEE